MCGPIRAQGPDPFLILKDFFRRRAMDLVPIAARDNGHFLDGKVLVHLVKGRRGPRPAGVTDDQLRPGGKIFVAVFPVPQNKARSRNVFIFPAKEPHNGRATQKPSASKAFAESDSDVIKKRSHDACHTDDERCSPNGFDADPKIPRFNSLFVEDISHKAKGCMVQPFLWGEPFTSKTFILIHSLLYFF